MDNWVLCSDELPEEDDDYLVLWKDRRNHLYYEIQEFYVEEGWQINIPQALGTPEIIAWQELPAIPEGI